MSLAQPAPTYAGFPTLHDATCYRTKHGGRVFFSNCGQTIWFAPSMTVSQIFLHPATRGLSGTLL